MITRCSLNYISNPQVSDNGEYSVLQRDGHSKQKQKQQQQQQQQNVKYAYTHYTQTYNKY